MTQLLLSLLPFVSTLLGGAVAVRMQKRLTLILGFTAGVLLGIVCFDLLPEIFALVRSQNLDARLPMIALAGGFFFFHGVSVLFHAGHQHEGAEVENHAPFRHPQLGLFAALALVGHSFMDGVGIGIGFAVSPAVGISMAGAVIAHDFVDGFNTVNLMLAHRNPTRRAIVLLFLDALAPVAGAFSTHWLRIPPHFLAVYLGFFAGFLLHIGTTGILPEAPLTRRLTFSTLGLMALGAVFVFVVKGVMP